MAKKQAAPAQRELFSPMHFAFVDPRLDHETHLIAPHINGAVTMTRFGILHPQTVFEQLDKINPSDSQQYLKWSLCGVEAMVTPKRLRSFKDNCKCVSCGREGNVFLIERHVNEPTTQYLNLYAYDSGHLTLMTVDHILPDCLGGKYHVDNFQTMCRACNSDKANLMSLAEIERVRQNMGKYAKGWVRHDFLSLLLDLQMMIHQAKRNSAQRTQLIAIFDQHRKKIKFNTGPVQALSAIKALKVAINEFVNGKPVVVAENKAPWWAPIKRMYKKMRRSVFRRVSHTLRQGSTYLMLCSNVLAKEASNR